MQEIPASFWTLLAGIVVTAISFWVGQNHGLFPEQASNQAPLVDGFFNFMFTIAVAFFLVVQGAIVVFIIRYRRRPGDDADGSSVRENLPLEILWTAIPAIIVIGLGVYSVDVYRDMGGLPSSGMMMAHHHSRGSALAAPLEVQTSPALTATTYGLGGAPMAEENHTPDLTVNVTGLQFAWIFNYANQQVTAGELHVPRGQDVLLKMTANDVIHSFWVPQFRIKQDVFPGQFTELRFIATKTGEFPVVCAELCGSYHGGMRTRVIVQEPADFERWLTESQVAQASGQTVAQATPSTLLTSYAQDLGITQETLAQLPH